MHFNYCVEALEHYNYGRTILWILQRHRLVHCWFLPILLSAGVHFTFSLFSLEFWEMLLQMFTRTGVFKLQLIHLCVLKLYSLLMVYVCVKYSHCGFLLYTISAITRYNISTHFLKSIFSVFLLAAYGLLCSSFVWRNIKKCFE